MKNYRLRQDLDINRAERAESDRTARNNAYPSGAFECAALAFVTLTLLAYLVLELW